MLNVNEKAKPFVKWAGGKQALLYQIKRLYPHSIGKYCEPFVGGGAVLFNVLENFCPKEVFINDINPCLINAYKVIKHDVKNLIDLLQGYKEQYCTLLEKEQKQYYYQKRCEFNALIAQNATGVKLAALFIFLNKTCFNGLYRVNKSGLFNVPFNYTRNPLILDKDNLLLISQKLQNVIIHCGDYKSCFDFVDSNTFCYFDPPYRPLSKTAGFVAYSKESFTDKEQQELASFVQILSSKGANILLSNCDPKNTDKDDNFFDDLYKDFNIKRIKALRMINSKGDKRGAVSELLVANF